MLCKTVLGSWHYFSYFRKLAYCLVRTQILAVKLRFRFADALLRRVALAGAITRLAASKTHFKHAGLAKHLAQSDRSETDGAVFQSCLERLMEDGVFFDAVA